MIKLIIMGRGGNQLTQYAYVRALLEKRKINKEKLLINTASLTVGNSEYKNASLVMDEYDAYPYETCDYSLSDRIKYKLGAITGDENVKNSRMPGSFTDIHPVTDADLKKKDLTIEGYFENSKYFDGIRNILLQELRLKDKSRVKDQDFLNRILDSEAICLSVRRFASSVIDDQHKNLSAKYYMDGVNRVIAELKNKSPELADKIKIFVFSDDLNWCKENLSFEYETFFEAGDDSPACKLEMMECCKHFVIANSTFSWWAMYLADNEDKIVVWPYCKNLGFFANENLPAGIKKENYWQIDANDYFE